MKTLIFSETFDSTTDVLIKYIGSNNIFRLNFDDQANTKISIDKNKIYLNNGFHEISDMEIKKAYWRKPFNAKTDYSKFVSAEYKYIFREIFNMLRKQSKTILILPNAENYCGKLLQLQIASKYIHVPSWKYSLNLQFQSEEKIVKSLSSEIVSENKVLYTSHVNLNLLDITYPWFTQEYVEADFDITCVYIYGKIFSYSLERRAGLVDWRKEINKKNQDWKIIELPQKVESAIKCIMNEFKLKFGRLDLLKKSNKYYFLEINLNGQWAWLDIENNNGLMHEMISQISPLTDKMATV